MISFSAIEAIQDIPIEQVIGRYLDLKRAGSSLKAYCPFHEEKTASFSVNPAKGIWKCFGCGQSGDAIEFVKNYEHLSFQDACKSIAAAHNITIQEEQNGRTYQPTNEEECMLTLMQQAFGVYRKALNASIEKYLIEERKLKPDTIIDWGLCACPDWNVFTDTNIDPHHLAHAEAVGLVRTKNGRTFDYFHHRILIPIHDHIGRVVGFGGRILENGEPKYLNSPDSPIYKKSEILFGFHRARKNFKRQGLAVLVEGYFDAIKLHQEGWDNTVATCGTSLSELQAKILRHYTDTVLILRDGDSAGRAAMERDIAILATQQMNVLIAQLPPNEDPDTLFDQKSKALNVLYNYEDGVEYLCTQYLMRGKSSVAELAQGIEKVVTMLASLESQIRVDQYINTLAHRCKIRASDIKKPLDKFLKSAQKREREQLGSISGDLPNWVDRRKLDDEGFVQLSKTLDHFRPGIYFKLENGGGVYRTTNFTLKPLYHIYEQSNNRRLVEVSNGNRTAVVEIPSEALVSQTAFEAELLRKGNFRTDYQFTRKHFKQIIGWLSDNMPLAFELKTLGWQPEGFFAYSDCVWFNGDVLKYDPLGMVMIEDRYYLSLGKSQVYAEDRYTDNPYENDLYLSYRSSPINFEQWANLFYVVYAQNAMNGIAYAFLTLFKDIVTRFAKMPHLYCYGPKGSGKSDMAESITRLFFSGKNAEGHLIKGYNLNPGQGTQFSLFNRVERFRNCPILLNEFDENNIEPWQFGTIKAAYDGEGREVGDGDTGKKRKTKIQKVQGCLIIVGQYISVKDDGSVMSRAISCQFSLERIKELTPAQVEAHRKLKEFEETGISSLLVELLGLRQEVSKKLPETYRAQHARLMEATRKAGHRVEERLLNNYSLALAAIKLLEEFVKLPSSHEAFFNQTVEQVIAHNQLLVDNSAVHQFWKAVEFLFDNGTIYDRDLMIRTECSINLKIGGAVKAEKFQVPTKVLYVRFSNVYAAYSKFQRERSGKPALPEDALLLYIKEQPYFMGLVPYVNFSDKRTSAYAFNYDKMEAVGIVLEKTIF
jgi:DNA primase catalytic core